MKTYLLSALVAFGVSFCFCLILIPILRKIKAGQNILVYVKEHQKKSGTPTMGGLAFLFATIISSVIFTPIKGRAFLISIAVGISYMVVGLIDDFLKRIHKKNLGLRAYQKLMFQISIAFFAGVYCFRANLTNIYLPFSRWEVDVGGWVIPISVFVFCATVNAFNLTDGLDGLASLSSIPFFLGMGIIIALETGIKNSYSVLCFCLVGALMAYVLFNVSPASVFMGDTGSLGLGGFASCICIFSGNVLYIPIVGVMFVVSVISVVLQVIYYKVTKGKRIFLMAPLHHHFQEKGYSESKISYAYFTVTFLLSAICIIFLI